MEVQKLLDVMHVAERLKNTLRHCTTSNGRPESVAEHSWRIALMAMFVRDEFPDLDIDKVIRMCLIHDLGECFTGDIPSFLKTAEHKKTEEELLSSWVRNLPKPYCDELKALYAEMEAQRSEEARLYKALDKLEAVIQHNESPLSTWLENEYHLNLDYANENVAFSPYLTELRKVMREDTERKIAENDH